MDAQILIDVHNPPEKIRISMGPIVEVTCKNHFPKRFRNYNGVYAWGYSTITKLEQAQTDEPCFDCTHNP